jgi:hypothetical protein
MLDSASPSIKIINLFSQYYTMQFNTLPALAFLLLSQFSLQAVADWCFAAIYIEYNVYSSDGRPWGPIGNYEMVDGVYHVQAGIELDERITNNNGVLAYEIK